MMFASMFTNDLSTVQAAYGVEQRFCYQFLGNQLWLHPLGAVTTFVELRYSYRPTRITTLADGSPVEMPEGSYRALVNLASAEALTKGNAEEANQFRGMGEEARNKLINSIRRQYHGMMVPFSTQQPFEWGGT